MRIDAFLRTRVARRVLWLFVLCALLPLGALAFVSYRQVSNQLAEQSRARLRQASKLVGMGILERLQFLENELRAAPDAPELAAHFGSVNLARAPGVVVLRGERLEPPALDSGMVQHLVTGRSVLVLQDGDAGASRMLLGMAPDPGGLGRGVIWGEIDLTYLWGAALAALPPGTSLCVFRASGQPLFCPGVAPRRLEVPSGSNTPQATVFEWSGAGDEYIGARWSVFLQFAFAAPAWAVIVSESKTNVLAPVAQFRQIFGLTVLLALWVVLLLSNVQIRRSLGPLEKLREGTRRLASHQFDQPVVVRSKDEFEDLAHSFNGMARELAQHIGTLSAMNEIDRAALSQLDVSRIMDTVLAHVPRALPCDTVGVALSRRGRSEPPWHFVVTDRAGILREAREISPSPAQLRELREHAEFLVKRAQGGGDTVFRAPALDGRRVSFYLVLPLFLKQQLCGFVALGYAELPTLDPEDLVRARQLADQVAVALSNSRLLEELDAMNWGTLETLARTIDARSHWTSGHSHRVTELALLIAREIGLSDADVLTLHSGGLLHDIGKIGVPTEVLDKPGRLTPEEQTVMRSHVTIGARLLEPIEAFAPLVPIALYHHEQWDGSGYPEGLVGEATPFLPRLLTIPDVFDALSSDRPYRCGWPFEDTVAYIRKHRGKLYDPNVVDALVALVGRGEVGPREGQVPGAQPAAALEVRRL
jgi:putative nucleotidyltransferase with HDIG domain